MPFLRKRRVEKKYVEPEPVQEPEPIIQETVVPEEEIGELTEEETLDEEGYEKLKATNMYNYERLRQLEIWMKSKIQIPEFQENGKDLKKIYDIRYEARLIQIQILSINNLLRKNGATKEELAELKAEALNPEGGYNFWIDKK